MRTTSRRPRPRARRAAILAVTTLALLTGLGIPALAGANQRGARSRAAATSTPTGTLTSPAYGVPYESLTPYAAQPPTKGALESDGQTDRYTLGGTWLYRADPSNVGISQGFWRDSADTSGWSEVGMPNAWNAGNYTAAAFAGTVGWYRRDFTLPAGAFASYVAKAAQSWELEFESVNYSATVWLNGHELGTHQGAYLPFSFPARFMKAGVNRLVLRVDDTRTLTSFPAGPQSGWWNFGGILDAVYLHPVQDADLETAMIRPELKCPSCAATIDEQATVQNLSSRPETVRLVGRYANLRLDFGRATIRPGGTWTPSDSVLLAHPDLWAPGNPYLYPATLTLETVKGQPLGGYSYHSGVREITWSNGLLYLNGRQLHLRGVSIHEQTVKTGAALTVTQQRRLINWTRDVGADIIREHYPLDPEAEEMADQDGILLWSEIPVYGSLLSTSQQDENMSSPSWERAAAALLRDNIETNQNHASILTWSIGNELPAPATGPEAAYIRSASAEARQLDPTRPVALAVRDWPGLGCETSAYAPLDLIGINEYFGWFDVAGGADEDRQALGPFLTSVRQCYPDQALMVTEMGYGGDRTGPVEVRGTYAYQVDNMQYSFGVMNSMPWLAGAIWFPLQDFAAEPGYDGGEPIGNPPFVDKGVLDQYGDEKPSFAVMAQLFGATQQIAPARR